MIFVIYFRNWAINYQITMKMNPKPEIKDNFPY